MMMFYTGISTFLGKSYNVWSSKLYIARAAQSRAVKEKNILPLLRCFNFNFILFGIKCSVTQIHTCTNHSYHSFVCFARSFCRVFPSAAWRAWCCEVCVRVLLLEFNFMSVSELLSKKEKKNGGSQRNCEEQRSSGDLMKLRIKTE